MTDNITPTLEQLTAAIQAAGQDATAEMYIARGKAYWSAGSPRRALNDYLAADAIAPNGEAAQLIEITRNILDYRNVDLLNP
jgi:hypothetical protein